MIKSRFLILIFLGLFIIFFIGIINKSNEFYEPELCIKYPSYKIFINNSDNYDTKILNEETKKQVLAFTRNYNLNEKLGIISPILAFSLLQLFLTFLFIKYNSKYNIRNFFVDVILFLFLLLLLFILLTVCFYYNKYFLIIIFIILLFNYVVNYKIRNFIIKTVKISGN